MKVSLSPGRYVVAVSGGVDSVVLLDLLAQQPDTALVVAHVDHGIRPDSSMDRELVATLSQKYGLPYEYTELSLGSGASEAVAREARYEYLRQICKKYNAKGIVTAHHQDDVVETLTFNVLRGTKRKGMSSLQSTDGIFRPLLPYSKVEIKKYARENGLKWREDSTNKYEKYTRNWIRRKLLPRLSRQQKQQLVASYDEAKVRNEVVDAAVEAQLEALQRGRGLDRRRFIALPYRVACEVMAAWLAQHGVADIDRKLVDTAVVAAKTLPPGKRASVGKELFLCVEAETLALR